MSTQLHQDIRNGEDPEHPLRRALRNLRARIQQSRWLTLGYRIVVATLGAAVTFVGVILIPLPGPGWLIVFLGLAILGSEFHWANRVSQRVKRLLLRFWDWAQIKRTQRARSRAYARRSALPYRPPSVL